MRRRRIGSPPDLLIHSVTGHHFERDLSGALKSSAAPVETFAVKYELFGRASTHQHGDVIFQIVSIEQEAILGWALDGVATAKCFSRLMWINATNLAR